MPVLMCLWNRRGRFTQILHKLDGQDFAPGVELFLWNNNRADHQAYLDELAAFTAKGALRGVSIVKSPYNLGSIARFYWARKLVVSGRIGPVIVIDDDEDFTSDFIATCAATYEPRTVSAWWAFVVGGAYYDRVASDIGGRVDHIGPGGMVCNLDLFRDRRFFTELPQKYWFLDDLWLTYFARRQGFTLAKLPVDIEFVLPETNQHHVLGELKHEFYNYLYLPEAA